MGAKRVLARIGRTFGIRCLALLVTLLILAPSTTAQFIFWDEIAIEQVDSWADPLGEVEELLFDISPDGSKLALAGNGDRGELRVTDRDLATISVLRPPSIDIKFKGVRWSATGTWLAAWGTDDSQDGDFLRFWNGTTLEPASDLELNDTVYLETIHAVHFIAYDHIIALSGLDENGTSRVTLTETRTGILLQDYEWRDGLDVLYLASDTRSLLCFDETGAITSIGGGAWTEVTLREGRGSRPTAHANHPARNKEWLLGDEEGWAMFWGGRYRDETVEWRVSEDGPVHGIAWAFDEGGSYHLVATPGPDGGSSIVGYLFVNISEPNIVVTWEPTVTEAAVTMLLTDPSADGLVWAAFADGSIALYRVSFITDAPPEVTFIVPEHNEEHSKPFLASGTVVDDHDRLEYVKVQIDEGDWYDVNVSGEEWSYMVGTDFMAEGEHAIVIDAFDGRHHTWEKEFYQVPPEMDDDNDRWKWVVLNIAIISVIVAGVLMWRKKKRSGDVGED